MTEAGCAHPLNLGFDIDQQDQDLLGGSQAHPGSLFFQEDEDSLA